MIIALTGEKLAGKTTAATYLADHYQANTFRFSQALTDVLKRLHQENSRNNLVQLAEQLRSAFGNDILAKIVRDDIMVSSAEHNIIDGMRYMEEHELLSKLPDYILVYITADLKERYKRAQQRSEKTDESHLSFLQFKAKEKDSTEIGIQHLVSQASVSIYNNGNLEDFYAQLNQLFK